MHTQNPDALYDPRQHKYAVDGGHQFMCKKYIFRSQTGAMCIPIYRCMELLTPISPFVDAHYSQCTRRPAIARPATCLRTKGVG